LLLSDAKNTNDFDSVTWSTLVSKFPIDSHENISWHLTSRNKLWSFLKLDELLVEELTAVSVKNIWILPAILFIGAWILSIIANPWSNWSA